MNPTSTSSSSSSSSSASSTSSNSANPSEIVWTISDCGIHTITSTTTSTEYLADTTFTTTVYWLTPNVIANNSTTYTNGTSTIATFTSYYATTTATHSSTMTTTYTTTQSSGCTLVHLNINVRYSGAWNGTYSYGSDSRRMTPFPFQGNGPKNVSVTFQGNLYDGICYSVKVQKDDSSTIVLTVSSSSDLYGEYSNSTSAAFGAVGWNGCAIS